MGSALLLSGIPGDVDAVPVESVPCLAREVETLERHLSVNPDVRIELQRHPARDLGGKIVSYLRRDGA